MPIASEGSHSQDEVDPTKPMRAWFLKNAFQTAEAFFEFEQLLLPKHSSYGRGQICQQWKDHVEFEDDDDEFASPFSLAKLSSATNWTLQDLTNVLESPYDMGSNDSSLSSERSLGGVRTTFLHLLRSEISLLTGDFST